MARHSNQTHRFFLARQGALAEWHAISRSHGDGTADTFLLLRVPRLNRLRASNKWEV